VDLDALPQPDHLSKRLEWGSPLHRVVARVAQGQLLGDALAGETAWQTLAGHADPIRVVSGIAGRARRRGLVDRSGDLTEAGQAWLVQVRKTHDAALRAEVEQPRTARINLSAAMDELEAGGTAEGIAKRHDRSRQWLRLLLAGSPDVRDRYLAWSHRQRVIKLREARVKESAPPMHPAMMTGRPPMELDIGPAVEALRQGDGLKTAARVIGVSRGTLRRRLVAVGLWPPVGDVAK
jgi:hypothetical protein